MPVRGVRGATTIDEDLPEAVLSATRELLLAILEANPELDPGDLASAIFTVTDDIVSAYPAEAARQLGWTHVPLMCGREIPVDGSTPLCVRVLLHWNTKKPQTEIHHVFLRNAANLRPDLSVSERLE
jgi:chorismate mutase